MKKQIIIIAGPTAVGKTEYAIQVAQRMDGEIVSADSMQLYKYMNIGSAKPSIEELNLIKHHLIDCIDPRQKFSAAMYQKSAKTAINEILTKGKTPIISGGTGLYINSLIYDMDFAGEPSDANFRKEIETLAKQNGNEYIHAKLKDIDPEAAARIHPNNVKKVIRAIESAQNGKKIKSFDKLIPTTDYTVQLIGLTRDRPELYNRINKRVDILINKGLVNEVSSLINMGLGYNDISMKGIGYKEIIESLEGKYTIEEAIDLIKKNTRHYAKRQLTWFRRYDNIKWFNLSSYTDKNTAVEDILKWVEINR